MSEAVDQPGMPDWATAFDHTDPVYAAHAPAVWDHLRDTCPVAHTESFGGVWLPVRHADVTAIAHDTVNYTSQSVIVGLEPDVERPVGFAPPITSDPPFHAVARRLLLPPFAPSRINELEAVTRAHCHELIDAIEADGPDVDAAAGYSQHIPVRVIAEMLGLPEEDGDTFRKFIDRIVGAADGEPVDEEDSLDFYLDLQISAHRANPRSSADGDLIDYLINADIEGAPLADEHIRGSIALLLIAGIDTTWSAIGAALWHLAQNPEHCQRFIAEPEIRSFAIEELLRFYAPVTMARIAATDHDLGGCPVKNGDWVLLPFPAANRDPDAFENADEVVLDRQRNRHAAFGLGIHRCLGSNLARMELTVAVETWLERLPDFELRDPETVRWSTGQIRGPRELPMRLL